MAVPIRKFEDYEVDMGTLGDQFTKADPAHPERMVVAPTDSSALALTRVNSQLTADSVEHLSRFVLEHCTFRDVQNPATMQNWTPNELGTKLNDSVSRSFLVARQVQKVADQLSQTLPGITTKPTIVPLPAFGGDNAINATALKNIPEFHGTGSPDEEAVKLEQFLRTLFDVCQNKVTEVGCRAGLLQKVRRDALHLCDNLKMEHMQDDGTIPDGEPTLAKLVLCLERNYFSGVNPLVAKQKLSRLTKTPDMTFQSLSSEIGYLARIASVDEAPANQKSFFENKCRDVFKSAISQKDRNLINTENQSRASSGLADLSMGNMCIFLLNHYAEKQVYGKPKSGKQAATPSVSDLESLKQLRESRGRPYNRFNGRRPYFKGTTNFRGNVGPGTNYRGSQENYRGQNDYSRGQQYTSRGAPTGGQRYYRGRNNYRGQFMSNTFRPARGTYQNRSFRGQPANRRPFNRNARGMPSAQNRPNHYVKPSDVGVGQTCCLKCASRDHSFLDPNCKYADSKLFGTPCRKCKRGGHATAHCRENVRSYLGSTNQPRNGNRSGYVNKMQEDWRDMDQLEINQLSEDMQNFKIGELEEDTKYINFIDDFYRTQVIEDLPDDTTASKEPTWNYAVDFPPLGGCDYYTTHK